MKTARFIFSVGLLAWGGTASSSFAQAQAPNAALGLVAKSQSGRIGNAEVDEGATVYTGDYLTTGDGGALLVRVGQLSLELESSSGAHIYRAPYGAVVELNHGAVVYSTPGGKENVVIVANDVRVTPVPSMPDFGRVAIEDACNITVYSQHGQADVQVGSERHTVEEGKAYRVRAENEISYRKYVSPDENDYHDFHNHKPCAPVEMVKGRPPIAPAQSHFVIVSAVLIGGVTGIAIWKAYESPHRP